MITFQAIPILIDGHDTQGQLVLADGELTAVLARLDGDAHDPKMKGWWHLEAGFGRCDAAKSLVVFKTFEEAGSWGSRHNWTTSTPCDRQTGKKSDRLWLVCGQAQYRQPRRRGKRHTIDDGYVTEPSASTRECSVPTMPICAVFAIPSLCTGWDGSFWHA
jgi:hypothetical protein